MGSNVIDHGRHNILGVGVDAVDYEKAVSRVIDAACAQQPCSVSALAVHGVMTGHLDTEHARRLNGLDLVVPDGQPVRWALRWLHGVRLVDRVYGPELTLRTAQRCAEKSLPVFFYGSEPDVLERLCTNLRRQIPALQIAGSEPSRFRQLTSDEAADIADNIKASGARVVFVGLGCPRQEAWAYEFRTNLAMPILAVGAAFDFHAGSLSQAPPLLQRWGLEWAYRLVQEPRRLWRRYLVLNPRFLWGVLQQRQGRTTPLEHPRGDERLLLYG